MAINQTGVQNALSVTTATAVKLTPPSTAGLPIATHAMIQVVTNSIRWSADPANAPTSTLGILVPAGANIEFMDLSNDYSGMIRNFKAIGISGTATLEVAFFSA